MSASTEEQHQPSTVDSLECAVDALNCRSDDPSLKSPGTVKIITSAIK